jgi:DNA polymerase I-like protein with 3'-5' exonuclease and polymerase domains
MKVHVRSQEAYKLLHDGILALGRAEQQGIRVDMDYVTLKKEQIARRISRLEEEFKKTTFYKHWVHSRGGKVNINSGSQLRHFLYDVKKIEPAKLTTTGEGSTDEEALDALNIPELKYFSERSRFKKAMDVLEGFEREQVNDYIHPFFNLHTARTYRSSSDHPNFQNIPKRDEEIMQICRKALFPRVGHQLMEVDYSGLEVKIAACYHKDPTMLKYINNPASDMHADMAKQIFMLDKFDKSVHKVLRQAAKNGFVFPEFYGDYYKNCASNMACKWGELPQGTWKVGQGIKIGDTPLADHMISKGIRSLSAFENHLKKIEEDFWGNRFPDYADWKDRWWTVYKKYGYVDLLTGFRCSGVMGKNDVINYPVQGAAFHCLMWSFIEMDRLINKYGLNTRIVGQIHDAIVLDVDPKELNRVIRVIRRVTCEDLPNAWPWIIVPLDVEIELCPVDKSWAEKEKFILE